MTVAVVTGGRKHYPTAAELKQVARILLERGATVLRHGNAKGVDRLTAGYISARHYIDVEPWPADWKTHGRSAGPRRNRAMLVGSPPDLFGSIEKPPADFVIALHGGVGTEDCKDQARGLRTPVEEIEPVEEPKIWNRHWGKPPGPEVYIGRGSNLGNPWALDPERPRDEQAAEVLDRYRAGLWARVNPLSPAHDPEVIAALDRLQPDGFAVCSCWPKRCHGEAVITAWRFVQAARAEGAIP